MERACVRGSSLPTATSSGSNSARLATRSSAGDSVMAVSYPAGFYPVPNGSLLRPRGTSAVARSCRGQVDATADVRMSDQISIQAQSVGYGLISPRVVRVRTVNPTVLRNAAYPPSSASA